MTHIKESINLFFEFLGYTNSDTVFFRVIHREEGAINVSYPMGKINFERLQSLNNQGYGIHAIVNGGGNKDVDVKYARAIFYEHDDLPKDEQKKLWKKLNLPEPTLQVDTGGKSIHNYWRLDKPLPVDKWEKLQEDLLEYSDGDRSIKNPSRVMRVPGFFHQKSGNQAKIISQSDKSYSYSELRQAIPIQQTLNFTQQIVTHLDAVPLENCLSKNDRVLISSGEGQGKRNNAGAKLARNIIGTAKRLDYLGWHYTDDPRQLFDYYCSRCTPPLSGKEANQIWKSAEKDNPTATLTDEALENCIKAWQRQNRQTNNNSTSIPQGKSNVVEFPKQSRWDDTRVYQELQSLAEAKPKKTILTKKLKEIADFSGWDIRSLRDLYREILEELDKETEIEDDLLEFNEILNSNEPLPWEKILPKRLYPILKWSENLGVNPEPVLVALEATAASLINPETRIVGRKCSDYEEGPTIFSAIVGEPGTKKSPITSTIAVKPLAEMDKEVTGKYDTELLEYERALEEWEETDRQHRGEKPAPPKRRQFFTGDYTPEALRETAQDNPKILRLFDELARETNSRGRYTSGKGGEAQQLLESYNGYLPPMNRKGKHYPSILANQSLLGGVQPDTLSKIMSSADPTGEFARYNIATLVKKPNYWNGDSEVSLDINPLLIGIYKGIDQLPAIKFNLSPEAYKLFENYHNNAETKANEETKPAIVYQYSKADAKMLRWALLYHILEAVANGQVPNQTVGKKPMQIAAYRMRYQINQLLELL